MDEFKAGEIRKYAGAGCCICALIAVIAAIIAGGSNALARYHAYTAARISAIVLFGLSAAILVFDLVTKAFSLKIAAIGKAIALVGFIGSFLTAPGCSAQELYNFSLKKALASGIANVNVSEIADKVQRQLYIGRYMIMGCGVAALGFNLKFIKSDS